MSLKEEAQNGTGGAIEIRSLQDVQALTTQTIEDMSDSFSERAFEAVRAKSAQKLAFKVASHTDGIVEDARDLLDDFLPKMFVVKNEPLNLSLEVRVIEAA